METNIAKYLRQFGKIFETIWQNKGAGQQSTPVSALLTMTPEFPDSSRDVIHLSLALATYHHAIPNFFWDPSLSIHAYIQTAHTRMLWTDPILHPHSLFTHLPQILSPDSSPSFIPVKTAQVMPCKRRSSACMVQLWIRVQVLHPSRVSHFLWVSLYIACEVRQVFIST